MEDRAGIGGWYLSFTHNQGLGDRRVMVGCEKGGKRGGGGDDDGGCRCSGRL